MRPRPILFGEVLFDCFPDGQNVLGGAPFNVCWHLRGFGEDPLLISRVGDDANGAQVRRRMREHGLDDSALQTDPARPTGEVVISLSASGQPSFDIRADQAYDFIRADALPPEAVSGGPALLYRGTLAARGPNNAQVLDDLHDAAGWPEFVDVNLRDPWWNRELVLGALRRADWAKLNDDELVTLSGCAADPGSLREAAMAARADWDLQLLILTRGAEGAYWITGDSFHQAPAPRVESLADTVGAGDAFAAVAILGLIRGWSGEITLQRALAFAAEVCRQRGATLSDASIYSQYLKQWEHDG